MSVEFIEYTANTNHKMVETPIVTGKNLMYLRQHMLENDSESKINHIFANAYKMLPYLVDPCSEGVNRDKVLCLGKVQSGKTAFFISSIALAFDNGYDLAYVIGGTKTKLKDQNYERLSLEFSNNPNVKIIDVSEDNHDDPLTLLQDGYKVIIVSLKNVTSDYANLGIIFEYANQLGEFPSIVIDDEGDECSPGAPKSKEKNPKAGRTHDVISDILEKINVCTYLSVTATPQANFLISVLDELSPDYALLVEPGEGYTGGNAYHDVYNNPHVHDIKDSDKFETTIPESFKNALEFFIFASLTHCMRGEMKPYSMLVHPSSLTAVQTEVSEKIQGLFASYHSTLSNINGVAFDSLYEKIYEQGKESVGDYNSYDDFKSKTIEFLPDVLRNVSVFEFNVSESGRESIEREENDKSRYKIFVGGNMLGRGLTIKNLSVTYMYRDSKITNIDTLYQRARWFGYKADYFDLCRVYMTKDLKLKFVDIVENENDMWNSVNAFLMANANIKQFDRIFQLNSANKLRLTRTTVSKTIMVERINPGYVYDKSISFTNRQDRDENLRLYTAFLSNHLQDGEEKMFTEHNVHFVIETTIREFYDEFVSKYNFPRGSNFGPKVFLKLLEQCKSGEIEDKIAIVIMRYKTGQFRSPISNGMALKELPESYNNKYCGDKELDDFADRLHIQIHPVYIDKNKKEEIIPVLAMNNPITDFNVRYVTGDNYYG